LRNETYDFLSEKGSHAAKRTDRTAFALPTRRQQTGDKLGMKQAGGILRELKETERSLD
jgi:hypothetical protein